MKAVVSSNSSAARTGGSDDFPFGRFAPVVASLDTRMISQTGVQGNRVRFKGTGGHTGGDRRRVPTC